MLAVSVIFMHRGVWSKGYTYKSNICVSKDDLVIVPVGDHWAIAKVQKVKEGYDFKSGIEYKYVHSKFDPSSVT